MSLNAKSIMMNLFMIIIINSKVFQKFIWKIIVIIVKMNIIMKLKIKLDFDDIKIEDIKLEQLLKKINNNNEPLRKSNNETITIIDKSNGICEIISKEEEYYFNKLINIIINDYKNYPNISHFFNIKNLLYFFNIEDKQIIEKEEKN